MSVAVLLMRAQLEVDSEHIGEGFVTGVPLSHGDRHISLEVPVSHAALDHLLQAAPADRIDLKLSLNGWLHVRDDNDDGPRYLSDPEPGRWLFENFGEACTTELLFQVARSDWFTQVVQPIGTLEYVSTEIVLPRGDGAFRAAVNHLSKAEQAYIQGDDAAVFLHCRGALDALPGAKQQIFDCLPSNDEARLLDDLLLRAGKYFHHGRHVVTEGENQGDFPIDHADARFALSLAKLLIAHTSQVLTSAANSERTR